MIKNSVVDVQLGRIGRVGDCPVDITGTITIIGNFLPINSMKVRTN